MDKEKLEAKLKGVEAEYQNTLVVIQQMQAQLNRQMEYGIRMEGKMLMLKEQIADLEKPSVAEEKKVSQ
jgi:hypothetical protein